MRTSLTAPVLANLAMMSPVARRGNGVILAYRKSINYAHIRPELRAIFFVLPPAPDRETAESTKRILHSRGWQDCEPPEIDDPTLIVLRYQQSQSRFEDSTSYSNTSHDVNYLSNQSLNILASSESFASADSDCWEFQDQTEIVLKAAEVVLEEFDGLVSRIDGDMAYVTLKSREHGDTLYGEYSAELLKRSGIGEDDPFVCKTVGIGNVTRVDIEPMPRKPVTNRQIQEIDDEIERMLPSDNVDY